MDLQQLLSTSEADLPRVLWDILEPGRCQCDCPEFSPHKIWGEIRCVVCGGYDEEPAIDIKDANLAHRFRDKYVAEFGEDSYMARLRHVFCDADDYMLTTFAGWLGTRLQPVHIFLACASLELERGKDE